MERNISIDSSTGELTVSDNLGKNPDGTDAISRWKIQPTQQQIEKHLPMFSVDIARQMNRGDREMIADIIAENIKESEK